LGPSSAVSACAAPGTARHSATVVIVVRVLILVITLSPPLIGSVSITAELQK